MLTGSKNISSACDLDLFTHDEAETQVVTCDDGDGKTVIDYEVRPHEEGKATQNLPHSF